jgi:stage V sporulation protein B
MKKNGFVDGSLLVSAVNISVGIIGFYYNMLLSKLIGAEAVGIYQMASAVMMPLLIITTAGIPTAVSRLVAEFDSRHDNPAVRQIFTASTALTLLLSFILCITLALSSGFVSRYLFKNEALKSCLQMLSPAIVIISLTSVFRGYYYGKRMVGMAGAADIIEQLARIAFIFIVMLSGISLSPVHGGQIASIGVSVGEAVSLIWLTARRRSPALQRPESNALHFPPHTILSTLFSYAVPLTITSLAITVMQSVNASIIPQRLIACGLTENEAVAAYGRVSGMVLPLIYLPFNVTSAIVINIIPSLSALWGTGNRRNAVQTTTQSIHMTLLTSLPLAAAFLIFAEPLGLLLYNDSEVASLLRAMGGACVFLALQHTFSGILNGIGLQTHATRHRIAGLVIQFGAVYCLTGWQNLGVFGYIISFYLYVLVVAAMDLLTIRKRLSFEGVKLGLLLQPVLNTAYMAVIACIVYSLFPMRTGQAARTILSLLAGGLSYVFFLAVNNVIPRPHFLRRAVHAGHK